ncbi:MAG: hypothetical protein M3319_15015 [Actinomycetota bacterium]|nr:hypothetical protein [Actinomycetota bacterium]MDQ3901685.1 hypothetical protein [Actinomycetota bacterium]
MTSITMMVTAMVITSCVAVAIVSLSVWRALVLGAHPGSASEAVQH